MTEIHSVESRWPPMLAILAVLVVLEILPVRIRLLPTWTPLVAAIATVAPMMAVMMAPTSAAWARIERGVALLFAVFAATVTVAALVVLVRAMVVRPEINGLYLLTSSVAVWALNVLLFSLVYWQIDRGGPTARAGGVTVMPDWLFPHEGADRDVPRDWRPSYVDYFFLGFATATAFSPTDALPLTARAKLLMVVESTISLVTMVMVAARAINILR